MSKCPARQPRRIPASGSIHQRIPTVDGWGGRFHPRKSSPRSIGAAYLPGVCLNPSVGAGGAVPGAHATHAPSIEPMASEQITLPVLTHEGTLESFYYVFGKDSGQKDEGKSNA